MIDNPLLAIRTATLVVAASDSSDKSKAQADYICDGTADNVQIQAAIDALPAGGGVDHLSHSTATCPAPPAPTNPACGAQRR